MTREEWKAARAWVRARAAMMRDVHAERPDQHSESPWTRRGRGIRKVLTGPRPPAKQLTEAAGVYERARS